MKLVVLDAHTLNPGDLSWAPLEQLGHCEIHARTSPSQLLERAGGAEVVLPNKTRLSRDCLAQLPTLKYIGVLATGYDVVDVVAAAERGVVVTNVPAYGTASVAQMTFALVLELACHVGLHDAAVRQGRWAESGEFSYPVRPLHELAGGTLGVVGFGRIGQAVARLGEAFGMRVVVHTPSRRGMAEGTWLPLDGVFAEADVLSLHCPLTEATARIVDARRLALMKRDALLVNTARGGLIDEAALADALMRGVIAGAALDVLSVEPPPAAHPLLHAPNCIVTPHVAWATRASRARLLAIAVDNVRAFLGGKPHNVVSAQRA